MNPPTEIDIRLATAEDRKDILHALRTFYWPYEPLSCGLPTKSVSRLEEAFHMEERMCILATDPDQDNDVVGFLTFDIYTPETSTKFQEYARDQPRDERLQAIIAILARIDESVNIFVRFKVDKVFFIASMGVDPKLRNKSIGSKLVAKALAIAETYGCKVIATDCTNYYTCKIAESVGSNCIAEVAYKDYVDRNGLPIFNPPPKHTHIRRYVKII